MKNPVVTVPLRLEIELTEDLSSEEVLSDAKDHVRVLDVILRGRDSDYRLVFDPQIGFSPGLMIKPITDDGVIDSEPPALKEPGRFLCRQCGEPFVDSPTVISFGKWKMCPECTAWGKDRNFNHETGRFELKVEGEQHGVDSPRA